MFNFTTVRVLGNPSRLRGSDYDSETWDKFDLNYKRPILQYIAGHGVSAADADDVYQHICLQLMTRWDGKHDRGPFRAFLCVVVKRAIIDRHRSRSRYRLLLDRLGNLLRASRGAREESDGIDLDEDHDRLKAVAAATGIKLEDVGVLLGYNKKTHGSIASYAASVGRKARWLYLNREKLEAGLEEHFKETTL